MSTDTVVAALHYAERGWPVFPVARAQGGHCSCGWPPERCTSPGKHALIKWRVGASTDPAVITGWWRRWSDANVGIATGQVADLAVLDVDGEAGRDSLARIEAAHGPLPGTLTAITSRGCHLFYRWPTGLTIGSGTYGPGIDHRGEGGYIIAPPSRHPSGHIYRWLTVDDSNPTPWAHPLPAWPTQALPVKSEPERVVVPFRPRGVHDISGEGGAGGILAGLVRVVLEAPPGERNTRLNWAAYRAGEHIRSGRLEQVQAVTALQLAAEQVGLTAAETVATIASGLAKGMVA